MKRFAVTTVLAVFASAGVFSAETNNVILQIDRMVSAGQETDRSLAESIVDGIEQNPGDVSRVFVQRLNDKNLTEQQLAVYVWALGLSKDQAVVSQIESLYGQSKSDLVRGNCLRAIAALGGRKAETFLLSILDETTENERRFDIMNLLGQIQSETALPKTEEALRLDIKEFYWQPIFIFGKMGDKATSFLLKKINDKDRNTRANSINVLGQWLIPPESAKPLQDQFWAEKDMELRIMILGSLERTMPDLAEMKAFFGQVADKCKERDVVQFARETLDNMGQMKSSVEAFARKQQPSSASFQREYAQLFKSAGRKGNYETLGTASTADDEPRLKALRERILQRDSDEAFYDYQKVNTIIMNNRILKATRSLKNVPPTSAGDPAAGSPHARQP